MKIICKPRQCGKTLELIKNADNFNGYIICSSKEECSRVANLAREIGCKIHFPISYIEIMNKQYYGKNIKCFHFDDVDYFLQRYITPNVKIESIAIELDYYEK